MRNISFACLLLLLAGLGYALPVLAQSTGELTLTLSRDFGYSSGTGRIQGRFSAKASGPEDLIKVVFRIDDQIIAEDTEAPFSIQFHTDNYPLGIHTLSATGYTGSGLELSSNEFSLEFVSAEEGGRSALKIVLPILSISFAAILLSFLLPALSLRRKTAPLPAGAPRSYGLLGGAICPKCRRPFAVHIWGFNLLVGKLDRCPHCGKWSLVQRAPIEALKAAEAAELVSASENESETSPIIAEERLRKDLDDSRFTDL